ncbi:uncharacterized protein RAG0_08754 [Rhynchosporium agropyri]|uniref:Uncharacterized protein n=1 Tax=Rhynchosporium agropyri TaxID=914238 RepID=A0A1E1KS94_9HELO|nr:uncharacterized protein RAG0_08754 [Rhynchosporium agropyri]
MPNNSCGSLCVIWPTESDTELVKLYLSHRLVLFRKLSAESRLPASSTAPVRICSELSNLLKGEITKQSAIHGFIRGAYTATRSPRNHYSSWNPDSAPGKLSEHQNKQIDHLTW